MIWFCESSETAILTGAADFYQILITERVEIKSVTGIEKIKSGISQEKSEPVKLEIQGAICYRMALTRMIT